MEKVKYISVAWILFAGIVFILLIGMLFILTVYANAQATVTEYTTDQPGMELKVSIYNVDCNWYNNEGKRSRKAEELSSRNAKKKCIMINLF